jgi:hypothetical protein
MGTNVGPKEEELFILLFCYTGLTFWHPTARSLPCKINYHRSEHKHQWGISACLPVDL